MKIFFPLILVFSCIITFAQDTTKTVKVVTNFTLSSRNVWRGTNYGNNAPSLASTLGLNIKDAIEIGATATVTTNGTKAGYGNWMELYSIFHWGEKISLIIDDYYFFNKYDTMNNYLDWSKEKTQHLIEAKLKYAIAKKINIAASYNIYAATGTPKAWFFEAEYFLKPNLSIIASYVAGASALNFYTASGVTTVGFVGYRDIVVTKKLTIPTRATILVNPNYQNIAHYDGLGRNPIQFVISLDF